VGPAAERDVGHPAAGGTVVDKTAGVYDEAAVTASAFDDGHDASSLIDGDYLTCWKNSGVLPATILPTSARSRRLGTWPATNGSGHAPGSASRGL